MTNIHRPLLASILFALAGSSMSAQNAPARATITEKLDTPQAHVYVATLQPRTPSQSPSGHATNRVLIYLDDGVMTRQKGTASPKQFSSIAVMSAGDRRAARTSPRTPATIRFASSKWISKASPPDPRLSRSSIQP
jgi:hypothetical protein